MGVRIRFGLILTLAVLALLVYGVARGTTTNVTYAYDYDEQASSALRSAGTPTAEDRPAEGPVDPPSVTFRYGYDLAPHPARRNAGLAKPGFAPQTIGALDDASRAAFRAADNLDDFTVPLKHQPWASGNYAKFAEGADQRALINEALRSEGAMFLPNNRAGSFRALYDFGRPIGARGETGLRVIVGDDGRIWTAFPVKP